MDRFWSHVGIDGIGVLGVVVSASVLYVVLSVTLKLWGRPSLRPTSPLTLALITLVGAVAARATLGEWPTLAGGVVAIATLMLWERGLGRWFGRRPERTAAVIMIGGRIDAAQLVRHRVSETQLWARLRQAGIRHRTDIGAVIVELDGSLSVLRAGDRVDAALLAGVSGADLLPPNLLG